MAWTEKYMNGDASGANDGSSEANGWQTLADALAGIGAGPASTPTRINVKARAASAAYAQTTTGRTFNTAGTTVNPVWWRGYNTTPGDCDGNPSLERPSITWTDAGMTVSAAYQRFSSINFSGARSTGALMLNTAGSPQTFYRCRIENTLAGTSAARAILMSIAGVNLIQCRIKAAAGASYVISGGGVIAGCDVEGGGLGIDVTIAALIRDSVFHGMTSHAVSVTGAGHNVFARNSFYSIGGDGIRFAAALPTTTSFAIVDSNVFSTVTGTAINNATGTATAHVHIFNNLTHSVGTATPAGFGDWPAIGAVTDASSPFTDAAGGDFSLVSSTTAKGAAFPQGVYEGHSFASYGDIGAVQRQETGGTTSTDPGEANVRSGTGYTIEDVAKTGTLVVPSLANTKTGVAGDGGTGTYDGSDRWTDPGEANVEFGVAYKANSATNNKTGAFVVPDEADVELGVTYGASAEFTGTLAGGGSSDWTSTEKAQIRYRLGIDGTQTEPTTAAATLLNDAPLSDSDGTLASATGTTAVLDASAPTPANSSLVGWRITVRDATGLLQSRVVTANTGKTLTVATWTTTPDNTYTYTLDPAMVHHANLDAAVSSRAAPTDIVTGGAIGTSSGAVATVNSVVQVQGLAAGSIMAATLATDAITAAKVASDAVAEIQSGLATAAALTVVDDLIDTEVAAIKADTAAIKLKTDQLTFTVTNVLDANITHLLGDAAEAAPDAPTVAEIADGVWDELKSGHTVPDSFGDYLDDEISGVTASLGANAPAGWINAAAIAADAFTAAKFAADVTAEFQAGLATSSALSTLSTAVGVVDDLLDTEVAAIKADTAAIKLKTDNLPASPAATGDVPTAAAIADAVWDEPKAGHVTAATYGAYLDAAVSGVSTGGVSASDIAAAVWDAQPEGTPLADIAAAVRDVSNASPASGSLGEAINDAGSAGGGATAEEVAAAILVTPSQKLATDASGRVTGSATLLDAVPMTLTAAPTNFREWFVWLTCRFRRTARNKTTGTISIYGSDGSTVVTTQTSTDTDTAQTTGVPS